MEKTLDFGHYWQKWPSLKKAIESTPLIIGVAPNAWPRIVPSWFFPHYKILCYRDRQDTDYIRDQGVEVFSLRRRDPKLELERISASRILESPLARKFLSSQKKHVLLVYKSSGRLDQVGQEMGEKLLTNSVSCKTVYEDKRIFREVLEKVGVEVIPGESILIDELTEERLASYQERFGQQKLVLQLAEVTYGGGSGTLFLDDAKQLKVFHDRVKVLREKLSGKKKKLEMVNVTPFLNGPSPSVTCCATRHGTLVSSLQTQILDIAEVGGRKKDRSGNFCGHDWSFKHYPPAIQKQANEIACRLGDYMYQQGYRGIFGLDFLVEKGTGKVWPIECNPRYTDAFPVVSLLLMKAGVLPMDIFHILELSDIDYQLDFEELAASYQKPLEGSQIILHTGFGEEETTNRGVLPAGIYKLRGDRLDFVRPGFTPLNLKGKSEFLFTEGLPKQEGAIFGTTGRVCRLICSGGMLVKQGGLKPEVSQVIKLAYDRLKLRQR